MNVLKKKFFLSILIPVLVIFSCKKTSNQPNWDVAILAPLLNSSLNINNLITDTLLKSNPDSSINLVYSSDLISYSADTLAKVPDTTVTLSFPSFGTFSGGDTILPTTTNEIDFKLGSIKLKKAILASAFIQIEFVNAFDSTILFQYKIASASGNGKIVNIIDSVPGDSTYNKTFSLANYTLSLTGLKGIGSNALITSISFFVSKKVISTSGKRPVLVLNQKIFDAHPAFVGGYLGQTTINIGPDETSFGLFKQIKSGILNFPSVSVNVDIMNSIGVDATMNIGSISSINSRTGITIPLKNLSGSGIIGNPINITRAALSNLPSPPVVPTSEIVTLNNKNSNISQFLSNLPDQLSYSLQVMINPLGNVSGDHDFVCSGYGLNANMNVTIPLSLIATNLVLSDTLLLNLSSFAEEQNINGGYLYLYVTNGLPFSASLQVYLLNKKRQITDSLLVPPNNNTILSALIGTNGKVSQAVSSKLTIPVTKTRLNNLNNAIKALVIARFNTGSGSSPVNIYTNNSLTLKLVADFNYNLSPTIN